MRSRISVTQGDITKQTVDAIVNAANTSLRPGGGVSGAIHKAAGPRLAEECRSLGGCPTGEARITKGYDLPAAWVVHTVGPVWEGGDRGEDELLAGCYRNSLGLAEKANAKAVAFPSISTGIFGFPVERASRIAVAEIAQFLDRHEVPERVTVVCFDPATYRAYASALDDVSR